MSSPVFNPIDGMTGYRPVIDARHALTHEGYSFCATHTVGVGTATVASILIQTPSTGGITYHLNTFVETRVSASVAWTLSEAPNASGGTAVTPLNMNRQSTSTTGCIITHTPTYVSAGTIMWNGNQGVTPSDHGGMWGNSNLEWILKRDTLYLVRVTAYTAASSVVINAVWYEEGR
jgi:hypothetical protein